MGPGPVRSDLSTALEICNLALFCSLFDLGVHGRHVPPTVSANARPLSKTAEFFDKCQ
jgi:hypothetical protein